MGAGRGGNPVGSEQRGGDQRRATPGAPGERRGEARPGARQPEDEEHAVAHRADQREQVEQRADGERRGHAERVVDGGGRRRARKHAHPVAQPGERQVDGRAEENDAAHLSHRVADDTLCGVGAITTRCEELGQPLAARRPDAGRRRIRVDLVGGGRGRAPCFLQGALAADQSPLHGARRGAGIAAARPCRGQADVRHRRSPQSPSDHVLDGRLRPPRHAAARAAHTAHRAGAVRRLFVHFRLGRERRPDQSRCIL